MGADLVTRPPMSRWKDRIGWLLGYYGCPVCGRTMWHFDEDEWAKEPTPDPFVSKLVCKAHLR